MSLACFASTGAALDSRIADFVRHHRHLDTTFGRIAYAELGIGPAALFLHGWPLNSYHWRDVIVGLSGVRRCIAPDFMGLGHTDTAAGTDLAPISQCAMIVALLDTLSIGQVDLLANDSVNRRPKGTPYRRAKGTPFVEQRDGYDGRAVRAGCGVGRA